MGVDRVHDADEHPLIRLEVLADDTQNALSITLARQCDVKISGFELEEARKQFGVIDVGAVRRVTITAGARVDADALPFLSRKIARGPDCSNQ